MQHQRRTDRAIVGHAVERRQPDLHGRLESADAAGCRHRHADDQQRDEQKRARERHVDAERLSSPPRCRGRSTATAEPTTTAPAHRRLGVRTTASPSAEPQQHGRQPVRELARAADARACRPSGPTASGSRAAKNIATEHQQRAARRPTTPPTSTRPYNAAVRPVHARIEEQHERRQQQTQVTASSSRSTMIVANVAVALSPSCRASRYGRITSPARAGSTALAANPIIVVRNAGREPAWPIGASRYCHRSARSTMVTTVTAADSAISHGSARLISAQTTSRCAPRRKSASKPIDRTTMTTVRSRFASCEISPEQRVYYKGGHGECQERISSGRLAA